MGRFGCRGDTPESRVIEKFIRVNKRHRRVLEGILNSTGVFRSQHQILMFIADCPGVSQKELAGQLGVSTATVAVSLKKLEQGGYISRIVDPRDNRYNQICVTEKGKKVAQWSISIFEEMERAMFRGFSQEEFQLLGQLLDRVYDNLETFAPEKEDDRRKANAERF